MSADEDDLSIDPGDVRVEIGNADRYSGIVLCVLAAAALWQASHLPFGSIKAPGAGFFPILLSTLLLAVSAVIVLRSFFAVPKAARFSARSGFVVLAAIALVAYAFVVSPLGFPLATIIVLLLMMRGFGGMQWSKAVLIAVPAVLIAYFGFLQLGVPLPKGILPY